MLELDGPCGDFEGVLFAHLLTPSPGERVSVGLGEETGLGVDLTSSSLRVDAVILSSASFLVLS